MDREVVKISEIFYRAAQVPISVVMAARRGVPSEQPTALSSPLRNYYTRLHVCPEDADSNEQCHEIQGHYDMTWDEAVKSFYTRQLNESMGTDLAKFAQQMVCAELKKELEAYRKKMWIDFLEKEKE